MNGPSASQDTRRWQHASVARAAGALLVATAASLAAPPLVAMAADRPTVVGAHIPAARLAGTGLLRWYGLRIYEARLWTEPRNFRPDALRTSGFALELRYDRALAGGAIAVASRDEIARLGLGSTAQRAAWFEAMAGLFPDVAAGESITGVYLPGRGVVFYRDDQLLGRIEDPEFGPAFFSIWLHPDTSAPELRKALLGRDALQGMEAR